MIDHLRQLEAEAIYILRETAAQFDRPALLFSGGKDSITLVHLSLKAFRPGKFPYPLVHIDTGHNFPETITYRDDMVKNIGETLIARHVQDSINKGTAIEEKGRFASRNMLQTVTLLETIDEFRFDACIGGARRDEEKARAKERIFSVRDAFGQWDPRLQRPELWNLYNGKIQPGENVRIFPLSNWTELDVWNYILLEKIPVPEIYFTHTRDVFEKDGVLFPVSDFIKLEDERVTSRPVRFRTVGDMTCTAAVESTASSVDEIISEIKVSNTTERGSRLDDRRSESAMEDRKRSGYF
ncbi:MAG: sulfate adenylyltransferase subunit CysD [Leptospirales bacterium]|nr:sulfate adenylyltransferase subunit CysD [Leptospirales bacterium]